MSPFMFSKFEQFKMNTFQYQILRYLPDRVSEEFVNLGVVVYDPATKMLRSAFIVNTERACCLFPGVDVNYLNGAVSSIKRHFDELSDSGRTGDELICPFSLDNFTQIVLPTDDSALSFSETRYTLDFSVDAATSDLFERFTRAHVHN